MALTNVQHASNIVNAELEKVSSKLPLLFEREDTFYSTIEKKNVEPVSGRSMLVPLQIRPGGNFGAFDPEGLGGAGKFGASDLGLGSGFLIDKATVGVFNLKMGVEWTKKAEWASDDSRKAVVNTFRHLLANAMADFRRHIDGLCLTAGNAVLGTVSGVSGNTLTLNSDGFGARLLRPGQAVAILSSDWATNRSGATDAVVTVVDHQAKTITLDAAPGGTTTGDLVVLGNFGNLTTAANFQSIQGVAYHHDSASSGTWLGMDRANFPEIRSNRVNANSSAFSLPYARRAINMIGDRLGQDQMGKVVAWTHPAQKQAYEELGQVVSVINKTTKDDALNLYFGDGMQMAGAPVKIHFSWNRKRIDFINSSLWGRAEMKPAGFYEVEGRKLFELRASSGAVKPIQIFYLCVSMNTFHMNPAGSAYIDGLTVPTGY